MERHFVKSPNFGTDAETGVKPYGIVPLGLVCAGARFCIADAESFW